MLNRRFLCFLLFGSGCLQLKSASDVLRPSDSEEIVGDGAVLGDASVDSGEAPKPDASVRPDAALVSDATTVPTDASLADGGSADASLPCVDRDGFEGVGCYRCRPTDIVSLENACTDAECVPFDNARRLSRLTADGRLPDLPSPPEPAPVPGGAGLPTVVRSVGVACSDLTTGATPVYVTGSTAVKPFLQQIAQQLSLQKVFVVYTSTGSCIGVDAVLNGTPMRSGAAPAPAAAAVTWDSPTSSGKSCDLPSEGVAADIGVSDVFAQTCPGFEFASLEARQIRDAHGPVQTMTFAVPAGSEQTSISAQAAYFVFGFGAEGGVRDVTGSNWIWQDESYILQRSSASGTQAMLAAAIGVPADRWKGKKHATSDEVAADLQFAGASRDTANKAIGILGAEYIDGRNLRAQIHTLAYRDTLQKCAFYPDSTATAHDKRNVRDGHYPIWSPLHLLYRADRDGNPANLATQTVVNDILGYLAGTKPLPNGVSLIDLYAQLGLVPECAMHVTRQKDGGNIFPVQPRNPCSCLFDLKATGSTSCKPCRVQGDCSGVATCSQGYCEPLASTNEPS